MITQLFLRGRIVCGPAFFVVALSRIKKNTPSRIVGFILKLNRKIGFCRIGFLYDIIKFDWLNNFVLLFFIFGFKLIGFDFFFDGKMQTNV